MHVARRMRFMGLVRTLTIPWCRSVARTARHPTSNDEVNENRVAELEAENDDEVRYRRPGILPRETGDDAGQRKQLRDAVKVLVSQRHQLRRQPPLLIEVLCLARHRMHEFGRAALCGGC
jgi:hypothetical protein